MLVLSAPGLDAIDLDDHFAEGYICEEWALGPPSVREVAEPRTLANGTVDWTAFVGARTLVMTVVCLPNAAKGLSVQQQIDRLAAFCRADLRPTLTWRIDSDEARSVRLRANPGLDYEWKAYSHWRRVGLAFVVPDSLQWATAEQVQLIQPTSGTEDGRTYYEAQLTTPVHPVNLLSDQRASAEDGTTTGWAAAGGGVLANSQAQSRVGTRSIYLTTTGAGPYTSFGTGTGATPVSPNSTYTWMASIYAPVAGLTAFLGHQTFTSAGTGIGSYVWGSSINLSPGWNDVRKLITTEATAAFVHVSVSPRGLPTDQSAGAYIDRCGIFLGDVPVTSWWLASEGTGGPTGLWGRIYDRDYPSSAATNVVIINPGQIAVPWRCIIYGPCEDPCLYNDTTGEALLFTAGGGLTLGAGESLVLDSQRRTATVAGQSVYDNLALPGSDWWLLHPGDNRIRFQPAEFSAGSVAEFHWRDAWL